MKNLSTGQNCQGIGTRVKQWQRQGERTSKPKWKE
jgi:hypothetical protein